MGKKIEVIGTLKNKEIFNKNVQRKKNALINKNVKNKNTAVYVIF